MEDIYLKNDDQPVTCPMCGARTDWIDIATETGAINELHTCIYCSYEFHLEWCDEDLS